MIGEKVVHLNEVGSTNRYALEMAPDFPEGTVVVARKQTSGKGRNDRRWESPEGGLWMSVVLRPERIEPRLVFVGALAVVDTLSDFGVVSGIKWPNDVWVNGRKIAGVLTEVRGKTAVLGIGLNVNNPVPPELHGSAVAMYELLGTSVPLERVEERLISHLDGWYRVFQKAPELMMARVRELTFILGRPVVVSDGKDSVSGRALDVLDDGSLLIEVNGEMRRVLYGDVSLRPL